MITCYYSNHDEGAGRRRTEEVSFFALICKTQRWVLTTALIAGTLASVTWSVYGWVRIHQTVTTHSPFAKGGESDPMEEVYLRLKNFKKEHPLPADIDSSNPRDGGDHVHERRLPDFAEDRKRRALYREKVKKYEVEQQHTIELVYCDGKNPLGILGHSGKDSEYMCGFVAGDPLWTSSCQIELEPDPIYQFCDPSKTTAVLEICAGGELDRDMLERVGDVGQDCGSWQMVDEFLSEDATVVELSERCAQHH